MPGSSRDCTLWLERFSVLRENFDSPRRREVIRSRAPLLAKLFLGKQLDNYAAVEGSRKYDAFREGRRTYLMTAAVKA